MDVCCGCPAPRSLTAQPPARRLPTLSARGVVPEPGMDFGPTSPELSTFRQPTARVQVCREGLLLLCVFTVVVTFVNKNNKWWWWWCGLLRSVGGRKKKTFMVDCHGRYGSLSLSPAASQTSTLASRLRVCVFVGLLRTIACAIVCMYLPMDSALIHLPTHLPAAPRHLCVLRIETAHLLRFFFRRRQVQFVFGVNFALSAALPVRTLHR